MAKRTRSKRTTSSQKRRGRAARRAPRAAPARRRRNPGSTSKKGISGTMIAIGAVAAGLIALKLTEKK